MTRRSVESCSEQVLDLNNQGKNLREISQITGFSKTSLSEFLRSRGIYGYNFKWFDRLTQIQRSILLGTLLGDGSLNIESARNNPFLSWSHGRKQRDYLIWKAAQFGSLFTRTTPSRYLNSRGQLSFNLNSRSHPCFWEFYNLFYSRPDSDCTKHIHKKMITKAILDEVDDLALAIWWCDDGSNHRQYNRDALTLCAGAMTESEYLLIEAWLNNQGLETGRMRWMQDDNSIHLRLTCDSSEVLASLIQKHVPKCMQSKLGKLGVL